MDPAKELTILWAIIEQRYLYRRHDAHWIRAAKTAWEGPRYENEYYNFVKSYGLIRGKAAKHLSEKNNTDRKEIQQICHKHFYHPLTSNFRDEARERWLNAIEEIRNKRNIGVSLPSLTLKTFWFYHPELLPMYDSQVRTSLSKEDGSKINEHNFLEKFYHYYEEHNYASEISSVVKKYGLDYPYYYRLIDKVLWFKSFDKRKRDTILKRLSTSIKTLPFH